MTSRRRRVVLSRTTEDLSLFDCAPGRNEVYWQTCISVNLSITLREVL